MVAWVACDRYGTFSLQVLYQVSTLFNTGLEANLRKSGLLGDTPQTPYRYSNHWLGV